MPRNLVYRRTDHTGQAEPFVVIAEYQHVESDETPTAQDMDDEEDAVWEAAITSGRLRVIPVR
jgi:hypothetical protein